MKQAGWTQANVLPYPPYLNLQLEGDVVRVFVRGQAVGDVYPPKAGMTLPLAELCRLLLELNEEPATAAELEEIRAIAIGKAKAGELRR
jgi:hypothetical protein